MSNTKSALVLLIILFLRTVLMSAPPADISFRYTEITESGKIANLRVMMQDSNGFLWVGANAGLVRLDGDSGTVYREELVNLEVLSLAEDLYGYIWVASPEGATRLNPRTREYVWYYNDPEDPGSPATDWINYIHCDHDGNIWLATDDGLDRFDYQTESFEHYPFDPDNSLHPNSPAMTSPFRICDSSQGGIWIAYADRLFLSHYDPVTDEFEHFIPLPEGETDPIATWIYSIEESPDGLVFMGSYNKGLIIFDPSTSKTNIHIHDSEDKMSITDGRITDIYFDSSGKTWITTTSGLNRFDSGGEYFQRFSAETGLLGGYAGESRSFFSIVEESRGSLLFLDDFGYLRSTCNINQFSSVRGGLWHNAIYKDSQGRLWVSDSEGVNRWIGKELERRFEIPSAWQINEDSEGVIWFSTEKGLYRLDPDSSEPHLYPVNPDDPKALHNSYTYMTFEDLEGNFFVGTDGALHKYNRQEDNFILLYDNFTRLLMQDSKGYYWFHTILPEGGRLARADRDFSDFVFYQSDPEDPNSIANTVLMKIHEADDGTMWIASYGGLHRYVPETDNFINYGLSDGFPDILLASIMEDKNGILWLPFPEGIFSFNPENGEVRIYGEEHGINYGGFPVDLAAYEAADGTMFIGGLESLVYFHPMDLRIEAYPLPVYINEAEIYDPRDDFAQTRPFPENLNLTWREKDLLLRFAAIDFTKPEGIQYRFRLEGWDSAWRESAYRGEIRYTNLPAGRYTFRVQASDGSGFWSDPPSESSVAIHVQAHPARTWWAISSYVLFGSILIAVFFFLYRSSQQKKLARERMVSDRLRKVDNLKDQFLANTTHELRTPLNGIIGLAESLMEKSRGDVSERVKKELSMIASSGRRLGFLINDILDLSRLKEGDIALSKGPVDLARLTNTVMVLSRPLLQGKKVELKNMIPDSLPMAEGDINRIQQILHNLIGNAVKFTNEGEISVSASHRDSLIEVTVSDTGIGIPAESLETIWESFKQVDGTESRQYSGTGLGLPITRQLVLLHGGDIRVESTPAVGSDFIFTLPVSGEEKIQEERDIIARVRNIEPEGIYGDQISEVENQVQVLLVDDEAVNRHVVQSQLEGTRFALKSVSSGDEAIKSLEEEIPDLILLDIMMPQMDGYEVCRIIRESYSPGELPVIMVSAKNQVADLVKGLASGANDFISKPYSGRELIARMETHLEVSAAHSSFGKFVPRDLMKLMENNPDKKINRNMTVLLSSFSIDRETDDGDVFSFVSAFLPGVLPVIRECGGIIFRYEGEGILSFFPGSPSDALNASLKIEELVCSYNRTNGKKGVLRVESSLHEESVLIGLTGDEDFAGELVASKVIGRTITLNKVGRLLGSSITTDEPTLTKLENGGKQRLLAYVPEAESSDYKPVYEIIASDSLSGSQKLDSSSLYGEALKSFHDGRFDEASVRFGSVLEKNPKDRAAEKYRERCLHYMNNPPSGKRVSVL